MGQYEVESWSTPPAPEDLGMKLTEVAGARSVAFSPCLFTKM